MTKPPLIVHLLYRLDFGGLETLLVECINRMPADRYRHAVVCLSDYTKFANKITQPGVELYALHKAPGLGLGTHLKLWKLLRKLRPDILHTYNLSAIEYTFTAAWAGVPVRVHAEHGRDASDPEGKNPKHNLLRRLLIPFVDCFVPVSGDLQHWLKHVIRVPERKNLLIHNGVDTDKFRPTSAESQPVPGWHFPDDCFVIGTVGRIQDVKNHQALIDAFILLQKLISAADRPIHLAIVGDGPLLPALKAKVAAAGIEDLVWLPGARSDIAEIMRKFSVFALPSIAEGTPVTILEAMATGLPVVATHVGGIPEVVVEDTTGILVPPSDPPALASALAKYHRQPELLGRHGNAGRQRVEQQSSMGAMLNAYAALYDALRKTKMNIREPIKACVE